MKEMHWTYEEYLEQPDWVIGLLELKNEVEANVWK